MTKYFDGQMLELEVRKRLWKTSQYGVGKAWERPLPKAPLCRISCYKTEQYEIDMTKVMQYPKIGGLYEVVAV